MSLLVRPYVPADYPAVRAIMVEAYADLGGDFVSAAEMQLLHTLYPKGQLVCVVEGEVVGIILTRWVPWARYGGPHRQAEVLDTSRYEAERTIGDAVYVLDICVPRRARRFGVAQALDVASIAQSAADQARAHFGVARLAGIAAQPEDLDVDAYVAEVCAGLRTDPIFSFHVHQGYRPLAVIPAYNPDDVPARGHGALVYHPLPAAPTPPPPGA